MMAPTKGSVYFFYASVSLSRSKFSIGKSIVRCRATVERTSLGRGASCPAAERANIFTILLVFTRPLHPCHAGELGHDNSCDFLIFSAHVSTDSSEVNGILERYSFV